MKSAPRKPLQTQLWKIMLWELVDSKHELVLLAGTIDWERLEKAMDRVYSPDNARPFCGGTFFEHEPPVNAPSLSRWQAKLGEKGAEEILGETLRCA